MKELDDQHIPRPTPAVKFKQPCSDCPYRRDSRQGWTGGARPEWFAFSALADHAEYQHGSCLAPCHQTVDYGDPNWPEQLADGRAAACAGALIMARNNGKMPQDPRRAAAVRSVDRDENVFRYGEELVRHHRTGAARSWDEEEDKLGPEDDPFEEAETMG
jgi:hypothetical protein